MEQVKAYSAYSPLVICRDLVGDTDGLDVVTIGDRWPRTKRIGFTLLGYSRVFERAEELAGCRVVHAHFAQSGVLAMPLARRLGVPLVVTCHGSDVMVSDRWILGSGRVSDFRYLAARNSLLREAAAFIAVSRFLGDAMVQRGFPADKVVTLPIGVDPSTFSPGDGGGCGLLAANEEFILSVARHSDVKGIDVLLEAFAIVSRAHPRLRLVQVGGGSLTGALVDLATRLGIQKRVDFLGPQSHSQVLRYIQSARALVLSSRKALNGAEEAFGLVLIEAAACRVPCVGTRVGGIPEAVLDGETGFIVESENAQELADRILLLVTDRSLANAMGRRGREMVLDLFDIREQTRKLEALYRDLC